MADNQPTCSFYVYFWDGEYEMPCVLDQNHKGDHYDGTFWVDEGGEDVTHRHGR